MRGQVPAARLLRHNIARHRGTGRWWKNRDSWDRAERRSASGEEAALGGELAEQAAPLVLVARGGAQGGGGVVAGAAGVARDPLLVPPPLLVPASRAVGQHVADAARIGGDLLFVRQPVRLQRGLE